MSPRLSWSTWEPEMTGEELRLLEQVIRQAPSGGMFLEIGTAAGGTLAHMMGALAETEHGRFVVVDPMRYFPNQNEIVRENLRKRGLDPARVDFRQSTSAKAFLAAERAGEQFAFVLIDGAHKFPYVTEDLRWTRLVAPGGWVCLHDYLPRYRGVYWAANRFLRRYPNYEIAGRSERLLVLKKTARSTAPEIRRADILFARSVQPLLQLEASLRKRWERRRRAVPIV